MKKIVIALALLGLFPSYANNVSPQEAYTCAKQFVELSYIIHEMEAKKNAQTFMDAIRLGVLMAKKEGLESQIKTCKTLTDSDPLFMTMVIPCVAWEYTARFVQDFKNAVTK